MERQTDRETWNLVAYFLNACNSKKWARVKLETLCIMWVPAGGTGDPATTCCTPGCIFSGHWLKSEMELELKPSYSVVGYIHPKSMPAAVPNTHARS